MSEQSNLNRGWGNSQLLPEARQATNNLLAAVSPENAHWNVDCEAINEQLKEIQGKPNSGEVREAVAFLLRRSHQAHPELPQIELFQPQPPAPGDPMAARIIDQTGSETWCLPDSATAPDRFSSKVPPRLKLSF
ncbi:MAG TPA: hypothetical protein V6D17_04450 [Candidatus Obscuribacterales bacterium]